MPLLLAALLGLTGLLIVLFPLLGLDRAARAAYQRSSLDEMADRESLAKEALREVEFDFRLGNLEEPEYQTLRERYERRAIAALKTRYMREQVLDAEIDRELATLREERERAPQVSRAAAVQERPQQAQSQLPAAPAKATARPGPRANTSRHQVRARRQRGG